jgi:hypothetical protein
MASTRDNIIRAVDENNRVASQYESVGDAETAAAMRGVANLMFAILEGCDNPLLFPEITKENRKEIRKKAKAFNELDEEFAEMFQGTYDEHADWEYKPAHNEAGRRVIDLALSKPKDASLRYWLKGMTDGVEFLNSHFSYGMTKEDIEKDLEENGA